MSLKVLLRYITVGLPYKCLLEVNNRRYYVDRDLGNNVVIVEFSKRFNSVSVCIVDKDNRASKVDETFYLTEYIRGNSTSDGIVHSLMSDSESAEYQDVKSGFNSLCEDIKKFVSIFISR